MNRELAEHISLMAAALYAVLAAQERTQTTNDVAPEKLALMRRIAIEQAHALWLDTLDY